MAKANGKKRYGLTTFGPAPGSPTFKEQSDKRVVKAKKKVHRAAEKLPAEKYARKRYPTLKDPTPTQRRTIADAEKKHQYRLKKYEPAPPKDKLKKKGKGGLAGLVGSVSPLDVVDTIAGITDPLSRVPVVGKFSPAKAVRNLVIAEVTHPIKTTKATIKGARDTAAAIPSGIVAAATTRPDKTASAIIKDYERRYGQSSEEQVKRYTKEGVVPELLDATIALGGGTAAAGRVVTKVAKTGKLGPRAKQIAAAPRPALRSSGGKAKLQPKSPNYFKAEAQTMRDRVRARKQAAAVAGIEEGRPAGVLAVQAERANRTAGGSVVEVAPRRNWQANKEQRVAVARTKGRAVSQRKSEEHRTVERTARKVINGLSAAERRAFYYVASGTVSADPARAAAQLAKRRESITAARQAAGIVTPRGLAKKTDELRTIDTLLKDAEAAFTERVADTVRALQALDIATGRTDPALVAGQRLNRRYAQQAETLGLQRGVPDADDAALPAVRYADEGTADYVRRVQAAADTEGLERPLYFPSEKYALADQPDFAAHAVGGTKATRPDYQYTGKLFRTGRQDTSPEVYLTGLSRTIKRKHNWKLVADTLDEHSFEGLRNMNLSQARAELADRGVDMSGVAFWNPRLYRAELTSADASIKGANLERIDANAEKLEADDYQQANVRSSLAKSAFLVDELPEYVRSTGWSVVPRAVYKEIMDSTKPSGAVARSYDIVKSKQGRIMLGSLNVPWLTFQVGSNLLLAAPATGGRLPVALVQQAKWYRGLTDAQRDLVDSLVGEGSGSASTSGPRLGAAASNRLVNTYRALKDNPIWDRPIAGGGPSARRLNPIQAMFDLDRAQNTVFRRAVLHDSLKREAFQRMGRDVDAAQQAQGPITRLLSMGPKEQIDALLANKELLERHAAHVDDWLGNWTTFTAKERKAANRALMFYPFLRFSLKLAFYTLPTKHPLLLSIAGKLAELQQDELKRLDVGEIPWSLGKIYFTRDGKLKEIDLARANPVMNQLTSIQQPSQIYGLLPPAMSALLDQSVHRTAFKDKEWAVDGVPAHFGMKGSDYGLKVRAKILGDDLLSLAYPYREAKKQLLPGPQGDDSLLFAPRPTKYKRKDVVKSIKQGIERHEQQNAIERLAGAVLPFLGEDSIDPELAKSMAEREKPKKKKRATKRKGTYGLGGSSGGALGTPIGASGSSGSGRLGPALP